MAFFGGLVLAQAATVTGIDRLLLRLSLRRFGTNPRRVLLGFMLLAAGLSMFMSNTATAAMMIGMVSGLRGVGPGRRTIVKPLILGIAIASNIGGMATIIGTPPNAIAVGLLEKVYSIDFFTWMLLGLPPAGVLLGSAWLFLARRYLKDAESIQFEALLQPEKGQVWIALWKKYYALAIFAVTILLWMSGSLHGIPAPVVSCIPITFLCAAGIIGTEEIRSLNWDVLLLMSGGLALGTAITETELAAWLVTILPVEVLGKSGSNYCLPMSFQACRI